jgi:uncharacterized membrane protein YcaP (DUF421 family)
MGPVLRGIFGYLFLVFIVRIESRRPGKQMTPFDFVLIFFSGGLTLTTLVGNERSLTNAISCVIAIAVTHFAVAWMRQKWPKIGMIVDGTPMPLLERGRWDTETLRNMRVADDDVMAAARDKGLKTLDDIEWALLERNGEISIIPGSKE